MPCVGGAVWIGGGLWGGGGVGGLVGEPEAAVVEALREQDGVGEGVVHGQDDHGGQHALQHGAQDVEHVAR